MPVLTLEVEALEIARRVAVGQCIKCWKDILEYIYDRQFNRQSTSSVDVLIRPGEAGKCHRSRGLLVGAGSADFESEFSSYAGDESIRYSGYCPRGGRLISMTQWRHIKIISGTICGASCYCSGGRCIRAFVVSHDSYYSVERESNGHLLKI